MSNPKALESVVTIWRTGLKTENAPNRLALASALLYAILGLAYIISKSVLSSDPEVDLKYIWVAGRLWAEGINPYTEAFAMIGDRYFRDTSTLDTWLYPPTWWTIARSLAVFEFENAIVLWRGLNAFLVCAGAALVIQGFAIDLGARRLIAAAVLVGYVTTMQATPQVLSMGQTSIILYFGICSVMFGLLAKRSFWIVLGLVFVALKPQAGIVVFAALAPVPSLWPAIVCAILITFILCLPAFLSAGFTETVTSVIGVYLDYDGALEINSAASTTGLRHLVETISGVELSSLGMSLLASVVAFVLAAWLQCRSVPGAPARGLAVVIPIVLAAFVSFHSYDFVVVAPLLPLVFAAGSPVMLRGAVALGLLLIYRSGNLAETTGFLHPDTLYFFGSRIDSLAALAMFLAFLICLAGNRPLLQQRTS